MAFPKGAEVRCQDKGWMDDNFVADWVASVLQKRPEDLSEKSLLVLDTFRCHKSPAFKEKLADGRSTLAIIPVV